MSTSTIWHCCIIQQRFPHQMEVYRWLLNDSAYRVCSILHDKDISDEEYTVCEPDGKELTIKQGERKPAHYHCIIKCSRRLTEESMTKRFGGYVNFQACSDPCEYARYITHDTFMSKHKMHYDSSDIIGDTALYSELVRSAITVDESQLFHRLRLYINQAGSSRGAVLLALQHNDVDVLRFCASHAYFVNNLI